MKLLFVWPNKDSFGYKPIGLALLSAIAREMGWETKLFDTSEIDFGFSDNTKSGQSAKIFKPVDLSSYGLSKKKVSLADALEELLSEYQPDCVALSVLSDEHLIAAEISQLLKQRFRNVPIIWGGKYPTLNPEKTLRTHGADFVCVGEGLDAFRDFLRAFVAGRDMSHIHNIWMKQGEMIMRNPVRPLREELNSLPYVDWELFDRRHFIKPFDGHVYIGGDHMLNWGCPYHCTYCVNDFLHGLYEQRYSMRRYDVPRIVSELKLLKERYQLQFVKFHDEDFLLRPLENFRELSKMYKDEVDIPFVIETNPKTVTEEKAHLLKEMNCVSATLAIETGDAYLRKTILKRVDSEEDIVRAFSALKNVGIRTSSFNMLGIPFETRETYKETIRLNKKAQVQYPNIGFFYPFEGTELRHISIMKKYFDPVQEECQVYYRDKPALRFPDIDEKELIEMRNVFVLYVKLPEAFMPYIRRSEQGDEVGRRLRTKLLEFYDKTVWLQNGWYTDNGESEKVLCELESILEI